MIVEIDNFRFSIKDFCSKNNFNVCDEDIILKMIKNGYSFINIPPSKIKFGLAEIRFVETNGLHKESNVIIMSKMKPCPICKKIEDEEEEEEEEEYNSDSSDK